MRTEDLLALTLDSLENLKAVDIQVLDVRELTELTDYMVIASGRSDRQVKAIAQDLTQSAKRGGVMPLGVEGERDGQWVLVDLCDVVVHIMQPEARETYQLEKLWAPNPDEDIPTQILDTDRER